MEELWIRAEEEKTMEEKERKIQVPMFDSVILMLVIIAEIVTCVRGGLNLAVPLFLTWVIMYVYSLIKKYDWGEIEGYALQSVRDGFQSVVIVGAVGCLIGAWILCGTVPTLIYFGLQVIQPSIFFTGNAGAVYHPFFGYGDFLWFCSFCRPGMYGNRPEYGFSSWDDCWGRHMWGTFRR